MVKETLPAKAGGGDTVSIPSRGSGKGDLTVSAPVAKAEESFNPLSGKW